MAAVAFAFPIPLSLPRYPSRQNLTCSRFRKKSAAAKFPFSLISRSTSRAVSKPAMSLGLPTGTKLDIASARAAEKR